MIDLRSDTVTMPTTEMRLAISLAEVGDDVFGEDKTTNELQEYMADFLGKEAALFVTSGVMGNQLSIAVNTKPGDEVIVEADSHIFVYETAAPSIISRIQLKCIPSETGMMKPDEIISAIRPKDYYFPQTSLICLENTHNRHGGTIVSLDYIKKIKEIAVQNNFSYHCDGARLWNACSATGIAPRDYVSDFDTVSVCFSKGLGAPVGSIIASTKEKIEDARKWRKILGGGMRQSGIITSACLYAVKNHFEYLKQDHENALKFAALLNETDFINVDLSTVETNIVIFQLAQSINAAEFVDDCKKNGVLLLHVSNNVIRCVFHLQVSKKQANEAAATLIKIANNLFK